MLNWPHPNILQYILPPKISSFIFDLNFIFKHLFIFINLLIHLSYQNLIIGVFYSGGVFISFVVFHCLIELGLILLGHLVLSHLQHLELHMTILHFILALHHRLMMIKFKQGSPEHLIFIIFISFFQEDLNGEIYLSLTIKDAQQHFYLINSMTFSPLELHQVQLQFALLNPKWMMIMIQWLNQVE